MSWGYVVIIGIIDTILMLSGIFFGILLKSQDDISMENDKYISELYSKYDTVDITEMICTTDDTEYVETTIKHKKELKDKEGEK